MRAAILNETSIRIDAAYPDPSPAQGEALVRVTAALLGDSPAAAAPPLVPAHEFVGVVERAPAGAAEGAPVVGARVAVDPVLVCGTCEFCRRGLRAHCKERRVAGVHGHDGGLAELVAIPAANLRALPETVPDSAAVFCVSLGEAIQASQLVRLDARAFVTVIGDGPRALLCAQVMARKNATVRLLSRSRDALELCEKWGVRHRPLDDAGLRQDQDVVVDCVGSSESLSLAIGMTRARGAILLRSASGASGETAALAQVHERELQVLGSRGCSFGEALAELSAGRIETGGLITARYDLASIDEALDAARRSVSGRVLVRVS